MSRELRDSTLYCRNLTRRSATSFYYAFKTLPKNKCRAFEVVYAFMRLTDDISDDLTSEDPAAEFESWRNLLRRGVAGERDIHPCLPALLSVMDEFSIPASYMEELIDGTEQDLTITRFSDFDELYRYCYMVASVVGLVSLRVFGLTDPSEERWKTAEAMAIDCGQAFQLTNILRDIKEDLERDRIYLPQDELARYGLDEDDLRREILDERFLDFMDFQVDRAKDYYEKSQALVGMLPRDARPCLLAMRGIYRRLLDKIIQRRYDIWSARARVPLISKLGIAARAMLGRYAR